MADQQSVMTTTHAGQQGVSRRKFIQGVIATGATVSAASYVFRGAVTGQTVLPGAAERLITLAVNGSSGAWT